MTTSTYGAPRHAEAVEEPRPTAGPAFGRPALRRLGTAGIGLVALATLGGASYAAQSGVAVPSQQAAQAGIDLSAREQRAERTGRDADRPSAAPSSSAPAKKAERPDDEAGKGAGAKSDRMSPAPASPKAPTAPKAPKAPKSPSPSASKSAAATVKVTAVGTRYATAALKVRAEPARDTEVLAVVDAGDKVSIADRTSGAYQAVVHRGRLAWVTADYLSKTKPTPAASGRSGASGGVSSAPCPSGSSVENGLTPDAVAVHRAVCARFPQITSYGGVRSDAMPEHPSGRALDCMIPNHTSSGGNALGWDVANWLRANAGRLGVTEIIFDQRIWTTQRSGEGWRWMSDRGSGTANHRDHVHVSVAGHVNG